MWPSMPSTQTENLSRCVDKARRLAAELEGTSRARLNRFGGSRARAVT
jgi:hypothetical protein